MEQGTNVEAHEQYNTELWEKTAELEHQIADGISYQDRIDKEVDLVLKEGNLNIKPGDRILDLGSGTAPHAIKFAELTGAHIEARDAAKELVRIAKEKVEKASSKIQTETRKKILDVNVAEGNYGDIKKSLKPEDKFNFVTCMGTSFIYLKDHESYMKALKDYFDVLKPGGKLVLQWREKRPVENRVIGSKKWCQERGFDLIDIPENKKDALGRKAYGPIFWKQNSPGKKDGYGIYSTEEKTDIRPVHPYPDIEGEEGDLHPFAFGMVNIDADGNETALPKTEGLLYLEAKHFPVLKRMLEETGFTNVQLIPKDRDGEFLSLDGNRRLFAVIAEKPVK